jgi:hypothetical protein
MTRVCKCEHARNAHEHLRRGSDCALCECRRYRRVLVMRRRPAVPPVAVRCADTDVANPASHVAVQREAPLLETTLQPVELTSRLAAMSGPDGT